MISDLHCSATNDTAFNLVLLVTLILLKKLDQYYVNYSLCMFSRLVISLSPAFSNHIVFDDFRNFCVSRFWNYFSFIHFNVPGADSAVTYKGVGCDHSGIVFCRKQQMSAITCPENELPPPSGMGYRIQ